LVRLLKKRKMNLEEYEKDLLIEAIDYRLENDESLIYTVSLKENLEDLKCKFEEE
jgi:hypothetical protein